MKTIIENLKKQIENSLDNEPKNPTEREIGYSICLKHFLNIIDNEMKINKGDKVRIVNYGHLVWEKKTLEERVPENAIHFTEHVYAIDLHPELIGKESVIMSVKEGHKSVFYQLEDVLGYYSEDQLEKL